VIELTENGQIIEINSQEILPADFEDRIEKTKIQNQALMKMMRELLEVDVDYGQIPGVKKFILYQPGAQQLGLVFHLAPKFEIMNNVTDFSQDPVYVSYEVKCLLYHRDSGMFMGEGVGSCNSYERKYRYYKDKIEYQDPLDRQNTYLKMAKKRAYVDAILNVTGASRLFTQDEDLIDPYVDIDTETPAPVKGKVKPEDYIMPFGKHKNKRLSELPDGYLKWLLKQENIDETLKANAEQVLNSREGHKEKELTEREKEVMAIVEDDKELQKEVLRFLKEEEVKSLNDLSDNQYQALINYLQLNKDFNPDDFDVDFAIDVEQENQSLFPESDEMEDFDDVSF